MVKAVMLANSIVSNLMPDGWHFLVSDKKVTGFEGKEFSAEGGGIYHLFYKCLGAKQ